MQDDSQQAPTTNEQDSPARVPMNEQEYDALVRHLADRVWLLMQGHLREEAERRPKRERK